MKITQILLRIWTVDSLAEDVFLMKLLEGVSQPLFVGLHSWLANGI